MSAFTYGLVSYGQKPLAEYDAGAGGNYKKVARDLLSRLSFDGTRTAFEQGAYVFSVFSESTKLSVIVLSDSTTNAKTRFFVVDQIRNKFIGKYLSSYSSAGELSKSSEFGPEIARIFSECTSPSSAKLAQINANLGDVRDIMTENLSKALERSEKLEVMEQKAENIKESASQFQREAKGIRRAMCIQRYKWWVLIGVAIAVILIIIIVIIVVKTKK